MDITIVKEKEVTLSLKAFEKIPESILIRRLEAGSEGKPDIAEYTFKRV